MRYFLVGALMLIAISGFSGDYEYHSSPLIDSLLYTLEGIPDDSIKVEKLCDLAWGIKHSQPEQALLSARQALKLATAPKLPKRNCQCRTHPRYDLLVSRGVFSSGSVFILKQ